MKRSLLPTLAAIAFATGKTIAGSPADLTTPITPGIGSGVYNVRQSVALKDIPKGARNVRWWISIPDDGPAQRILNLSVVSAPGPWQVVRDKDRGGRFLYVEVVDPKAATLNAVVEFSFQRAAVFQKLDAAMASPLQDTQKGLFAEELRPDAPHMEATPQIRAIAREVCGEESNPAIQAAKLLDYVARNADHYSRNPNVPTCGVGDAGSCLIKKGGCCTDMHSLFIALARAAGIPARLQMGYRLQPKNAGIEVDPGYRCWAEYFIAGLGWVPADIVEADAAADEAGRARWFSGLSEWRVHLNEGREFDLPFKKNPARVNLMSIGYAEIDGVPARVLPEGDLKPQLERRVLFTQRAAGL